MDLKDLFRTRGSGSGEASLDIDDLIVLQRFDEAVAKLQKRIKAKPRDVRARAKLAEVYTEQRKFKLALEEYVAAADAYSQDGFYDRAVALLSRATKLAPEEQTLHARIEKLRRAKGMERVRGLAIQALRQHAGAGSEIQLQEVWQNLVGCQLLEDLGADQIQRLFAVMDLIALSSGAVLVEKDSDQQEMYLLTGGAVEAVAEQPDGKVITFRRFSSGDLIGEGVLLEHQAWPATYRAVEASRLLRLTREGLQEAMTGNPDPRHLLEILRRQHHDREVREAVARWKSET